MKNRISSLALAVSTVCCSFASVAADNAGLIGQLTNSSQDRVFAGAKIEITELGQETFSRRDGTFRLAMFGLTVVESKRACFR